MRLHRPRRVVGVAIVVGGAIAFSGCVSIKEERVLQPRSPGVVTLRTVVCASDHNQNHYSTCTGVVPNVAEADNGVDADEGTAASTGQILVGYRVSDGTVAPTTFSSDVADVSFSQSPTYTQALAARYSPSAGTHWVGYISTPRIFSPPTDRQTGFSPEFSLPTQGSGAPFSGPLKWRVVAGFRSITAADQAGLDVKCDGSSPAFTICFDSPTSSGSAPVALSDLSTPVSDFGVLAGGADPVAQGATGTVTFPVRYTDAKSPAFGALNVSLQATTTVPLASAQTATSSITLPSGGLPTGTTTQVPVTVGIPANTPPGQYKVTLSATTGGPPVSRSNTATLTVVDRTAPEIRVSTPPNGASFTQGSVVVADYGCSDNANGSGVASCIGPVANGAAIDTATLGAHAFTVSSSDNAGNAAAPVTKSYTVVAAAQPPVVVSPAAKPDRVNFTVSFSFGATTKATTFKSLKLKGVPAGSTVVATCKGSACPKAKIKGKRRVVSFTKKNAFDAVTLKPWVKKPLRAGTSLTITVTKLGAFGMVKKVAIRSGKPPLVTTTCLKPESPAPAACE